MENNTAEDPEVSAIVNDFLCYQLHESGYQWTCPPLRQPSKICLTLRSLGDEFKSQYREHFAEMCERLDISPSTLYSIFLGVANELFSEGIKWARIVALFVFGSELASHCKDKNWPRLIDEVAHTLTSYTVSHLLPWINDHGGWEGIVTFAEGRDSSEQRSSSPWPVIKNLVCGVAASALGALTISAILTSKS